MKKPIVIILLLGFVAATAAWIVNGNTFAGRDESGVSSSVALPVNVVVVHPASTWTRKREFVGTISAARRTKLAFERSARLMQAFVDEGQAVKEGQVLARLDRRQLDARFAQLQSQLKQQEAVLSELQAGPRKETIAATRATVAALAADVELKRLTLKRTESLFGRSGASAQTLDEVRLASAAAVARLEVAQRQLDELVAGTRMEQIAAQQALVESTQAQLAGMQVDIDDSELKAPFDGAVVRRFGDEGDVLSSQQPLYEILESGRLEARIGVPPRLLPAVQQADYIVLRSERVEFTGQLRDVVAQVDRSTRTRTVVIAVDPSHPPEITDGQIVRMSVSEDVPIAGFRVPLTALATGSRGLWHVYVAEVCSDSGASVATVRRRTVEVLQTDGDFAIVQGALYEGDQLIVDGLHRIVPGQAVLPRSGVVAEKG